MMRQGGEQWIIVVCIGNQGNPPPQTDPVSSINECSA